MSKDRTAEVFKALGLPWKRERRPDAAMHAFSGLGCARGKYHTSNIDADMMYPHMSKTMVEKAGTQGRRSRRLLWSYIPDAAHSAPGFGSHELARDMHLWAPVVQAPRTERAGLAIPPTTFLLGPQSRHPH